jgi:alpha-beta hydrolase superfamily lysophospholipase
MTHKEFNFNICNTEFYGQYWQAENTKAVVVLVHGMGEHSARYKHVAKKLNENDFSVVAFDHFGHGKTAGKRGHNPNFDAVLESVSKTIEKATTVFENKPIFLYGHSLGGNVVFNYLLRKKHNIKGGIATGAFLKLAFEPPKLKLFVGKILQKIAPATTMPSGLDATGISRIDTEVNKYKDDPLIHDKISPNFGLTFIETGKWALENASNLKTPMLLLHGTDDKIIDYKAIEEFSNKTKKATLKLYQGGYHELHNDLCAEEVFQDIVDWLNTQL